MLGVLLVLAVIGEISLRLFSDAGRSISRRDDHVGRTLKRNLDVEIHVAEADRRVRIRTNRDGFRSPDRPHAKPQGVRRLAVLGDSYVQATAMRDDDMMTSRLERHLGEGWEVHNFGHSGFSTAQALIAWRHYAKAYAPDVALYVFTLRNDVKNNYQPIDPGGAARPYFDLDKNGALTLRGVKPSRNPFRALLDNSHLYKWQMDVTGRLGSVLRPRDVGVWEYHVLNTDSAPELEEAWKVTEALFAQLRQEVEAAGARFAFTYVPVMAHYDADERAYVAELLGPDRTKSLDVAAGERRLKDGLARLRMPLISFLDAFAASCAAGTKVNFLHGHWNEEGQRIVAEAVYRGLVAQGLVQ